MSAERPIRAPAKINLGLRVTGRRPDGLHELESVFVPLDLADELTIRIRPAGETRVALELEDAAADVPDDARNLAVRAAMAFLDTAARSAEVRIRLKKRVPSAAGLGGGSSDAGAVLRALARAWPDAVAPTALHALATRLGADVPFFLNPRPALVTGIGERIQPLPPLPAFAILLANPGVPVSTAEVFRAFDALAPDPGSPRAPAGSAGARAAEGLRAIREADRDASRGFLRNDLEAPAVRLCPPIARLRRALEAAGAIAVGLSGSGPTVFGLFHDEAEAERARARLDAPPWSRVASAREDADRDAAEADV